jgi:hypothetical protein
MRPKGVGLFSPMYTPSILASHAGLSIAGKGVIRVADRRTLMSILVFM